MMRTGLAIDPGSTESAFVFFTFNDSEPGLEPPWGIRPRKAMELDNEDARPFLEDLPPDALVIIETMPAIHSASVAKDQLVSERWGARFGEMFRSRHAEEHDVTVLEVFRATAKAATVGSAASKDSDVRRAIFAMYGGEDQAKGKKCTRCKGRGWFGAGRPPCARCDGTGWEIPIGPLHGWTGTHYFAALAVAVAALRPGGNFWREMEEAA